MGSETSKPSFPARRHSLHSAPSIQTPFNNNTNQNWTKKNTNHEKISLLSSLIEQIPLQILNNTRTKKHKRSNTTTSIPSTTNPSQNYVLFHNEDTQTHTNTQHSISHDDNKDYQNILPNTNLPKLQSRFKSLPMLSNPTINIKNRNTRPKHRRVIGGTFSSNPFRRSNQTKDTLKLKTFLFESKFDKKAFPMFPSINSSNIQKNIFCHRRKILLLGNGSCGKTTIFKQFKMILNNKNIILQETEILEACHAIRQNCVSILLTILHKSAVLYELNNEYFSQCLIEVNDKYNYIKAENEYSHTAENTKLVNAIKCLLKYRSESFEKIENDNLYELAVNIEYLWSLPSIQMTYKLRHNRYHIPDNMEYFYKQIFNVMDPLFHPTIEDFVKLRIRTTGMIYSTYDVSFEDAENRMEDYKFLIYDTGGERNERKKWINCFENVDTVIFVAALNHYCCVLWEDEKQISMHDSIILFKEICNGKWFKRSEMILFLNKNDIFRELLYKEIGLSICFGNEEEQNINIRRIKRHAMNDASVGNEDNNHKIKPWSIDIENVDITPPPSPSPLIGNEDIYGYLMDNDMKDNVNNNGMKDISSKMKTEEHNSCEIDTCYDLKGAVLSLKPWIGEKWNSEFDFMYDLNKTLEENLEHFEECYGKAIEFIKKMYLDCNKIAEKKVYVHVTTAVDQSNIRTTFNDIRSLIIHSNYGSNYRQFF